MRKVAFTSGLDTIKKVMVYDCSDGAYVFVYDCIQDTASISDYLLETIEDAEYFCKDEYNLDNDNWILIPDPLYNCQHDFILPTRVKGEENGNPEWGQFQTLVEGQWVDLATLSKTQSFDGMTVNERLIVSGLIMEFDKSKNKEKARAKRILRSLKVDEQSIELIVK